MVRGQNKEEDESAPMPVKNAAGTTSDCAFQADFKNEDETAPILIVGAGIVGLVLALAIDKHCGGAITVELYEQAESFHDDVGAGMGMYPNGLRVIRDISPALLETIQEAGYPYLMRHYEVRYQYVCGCIVWFVGNIRNDQSHKWISLVFMLLDLRICLLFVPLFAMSLLLLLPPPPET